MLTSEHRDRAVHARLLSPGYSQSKEGHRPGPRGPQHRSPVLAWRSLQSEGKMDTEPGHTGRGHLTQAGFLEEEAYELGPRG